MIPYYALAAAEECIVGSRFAQAQQTANRLLLQDLDCE